MKKATPCGIHFTVCCVWDFGRSFRFFVRLPCHVDGSPREFAFKTSAPLRDHINPL
jgi:hypothetical protein